MNLFRYWAKCIQSLLCVREVIIHVDIAALLLSDIFLTTSFRANRRGVQSNI